jgi:hypothetical protein
LTIEHRQNLQISSKAKRTATVTRWRILSTGIRRPIPAHAMHHHPATNVANCNTGKHKRFRIAIGFKLGIYRSAGSGSNT